MNASALRNQFEGIWKWVPEAFVRSIPIVAKWRLRAAQNHADAASQAADDAKIYEAIAELDRAIELEPRNPEFLYALGKIYYERGDLATAESWFRDALNINFVHASSLKGLGYTLNRQGKIDEAIYSYLRFLEIEPNDVEVNANLIAALEAHGKYEEAIAAGERASERFPKNGSLLFMLARNNYFAGKMETAISQLQRARELVPTNPDIHRMLGIALKTQGDLKGALASFNEVLKYNPSDAEAHLAAAAVYQRLGRNEEYLQAALAARQIFEATKNDGGLKYACWEEAWALYELKRWEQSIKASECALRIDDTLSPIRFNLGLAFLRLGKVDRAKQEYQTALEHADPVSLKIDAIDDLTAALTEEPQLTGAREILQELEIKYQVFVTKRDEMLAEHSTAS